MPSQTKAMLGTARLELAAATLEIVTADLHQRERLPALLDARLAADWPPPLFDVRAMSRLKQSFIEQPTHESWMAWYWILRSPRAVVGLSGFKSKPASAAVEICYSVVPQFQRLGLATEAVDAMVQWAFASGVPCVFAETLPELVASQRVLIKTGFSCIGEGSEPGVLRFERQQNASRFRQILDRGCAGQRPLFHAKAMA